MFYWITNTRAFADLSWPNIYSINYIKKKLACLCSTNESSVKLIIYSKIGLFDNNWPDSRIDVNVLERNKLKYEFINSIILNQCAASKVWENDSFILYLPSTNFH